MRLSRIQLALLAVSFALPAAGAPAPASNPRSQGSLAHSLGVIGKLPATAPLVVKVTMSDEDAIEVQRRSVLSRMETRQVTAYTTVQQVRTTTVKKDGRDVPVQYTVNVQVPIVQQITVQVTVPGPYLEKEKVAAKSCKFFIVTREGKLENIEAARAATMLKKPTQVLSGENAEVDPRHLELIKAGTLYLVLPQSRPLPRAPRPLRKE